MIDPAIKAEILSFMKERAERLSRMSDEDLLIALDEAADEVASATQDFEELQSEADARGLEHDHV